MDDIDRAVNDMYYSGLLTLVERENYREQVVSYLNDLSIRHGLMVDIRLLMNGIYFSVIREKLVRTGLWLMGKSHCCGL